MQRKKILWLVSWYPNNKDRFDGDFIQRHARAAAIFHDIHVLFVKEADIDEDVKEEIHNATGLTEQIIYFKRKSGLFYKLKKHWTWKQIYQKSIQDYISKNGLPDIVHVHIPWKAGLMALWMQKKFGINYIISEHWGIYNNQVEDNFESKSSLTKKLLQQIFLKAKKFITVSQFLSDNIKSTIGRYADQIIPNVVDTTLFFHQKEKYSRFSFIHVSNMLPLKNVDLILKAFIQLLDENEQANQLQLILVGNRNHQYIHLAESMGVLNSSVFFHGEVPYNEVAEEMRRSHCLVLFSDSETFSCVTAEALCSGLPVISSSVGALSELINDSNGMLVSHGNIRELAEAMRKVWQEPSRFNQKEISDKASKSYGYSSIADQFDRLYREV
ncbi:MAG: glycosyltransferase family 4 protein [Flavisolibacter sp.]